MYNTSNSGLPGNSVRSIAIDGSKVWIGTYEAGLAVYNTVGVEEKSNLKNQTLKLEISQNPFTQSTSIKYELPVETNVSLNIYNASGALIETLISGEKQPGNYSVGFNAKGFPSGIYFAKFSAGKYKETKKLVLMK